MLGVRCHNSSTAPDLAIYAQRSCSYAVVIASFSCLSTADSSCARSQQGEQQDRPDPPPKDRFRADQRVPQSCLAKPDDHGERGGTQKWSRAPSTIRRTTAASRGSRENQRR